MKNYLKKSLWLLLASVCGLASCNGKNAGAAKGNATENDSAVVAEKGIKTMTTDSISVTWIQDNAGEKLMPRSLFSDAPDSIIERLSLQNGVPSSVSTFLVKTASGQQILFDTGLGAPDSRLIDGLRQAGIEPSDVHYLYLTHFHGDHIGGMLKGDSLVFPNAEVYASKAEYDAWMNMPDEQKAQVVKTMNRYKNQLHLFEFGDILPGNVETIDASGHTPGHTNFRIGQFLIIGDLMHGAALQTVYPEYSSSYDQNKAQAAQARKRILEYARTNHLIMAGMHLPAPAFLTEN
ncbi:MAG: MBL fold metallo-hydrolase [Bacteroidaceae bacterium]|jgi:glyoxylase-like metal-dependent hydrolase (beta-lactamase superfamily II)